MGAGDGRQGHYVLTAAAATAAAAAAARPPTLVGPAVCSVIKIILQFCKENSLVESFNAIQVLLPRRAGDSGAAAARQSARCSTLPCWHQPLAPACRPLTRCRPVLILLPSRRMSARCR